MKNKFISIETTYPNLREAKNLGKILLEKKLAACVQFTKIETSYIWEKKIKNDKEILVKIKTKNSLYFAIEKIIKENHSYKIPQIFSIQINQGLTPYFSWIDSNLKKGK
jgi:periplasmic divalent cation tolerance protein